MAEYKVLVPLDGSRFAEHALAFLPALRYMGSLNVTLISVLDFPDGLRGVASESLERERNLLSTYLREIAGDLEQHLAAKVRYEIVEGQAPQAILDLAEEVSPDLLVISTRGRSGLARWQRGSVADRVIREARCKVLAVGPKAMERGQWLEGEAMPPFKRILVPLDGSDVAEQSLPVALEFAEVYASRLHLFQVLPYIPLGAGFWETPENLRDNVLAAGRRYLERVAKEKLPGKDVSDVTLEVTIGAPATEIDTYIGQHEIDLVVMTSRGRSGLARTALGSVTDRVVGAGPPVLVVRAQEED